MKKYFSVLILSALLSACSHAPSVKTDAAKSDGIPGKDYPIIDAHTHTFFQKGSKGGTPLEKSYTGDMNPLSEEVYFKELKEAGVEKAIAHSRNAYEGFIDYRDRGVLHCSGVHPGTNPAVVERGLKKGDFHCIKVYLGYVLAYAYDPRYEPFYKLAQKYDVPVVFHTGDTWSREAELKYADPLTIDEVAVKHPKIRFVIAHCGNPWIESAAEVAYKNKNVYMDISAFLVDNMDEIDPQHVDEYLVKPIAWIFGFLEDPSKLMFGTDWPLSRIEPYKRACMKAIPREHWKEVFHDNALAVFTHLKDYPKEKK